MVVKVWYTAYGSNLARDRFRCYLSGGRPDGALREYAGCRDPRDPERIVSLDVPGGLVCAGRSRAWGGGMAFFDAAAPRRVACRAYLVTAEQFGDIAAQEMRRPPGGDLARGLARLVAEVESVDAVGPGQYATVTRLGVREGIPMLTLTNPDLAAVEPSSPSAPYLGWICSGLHEAHGWAAERIAGYLSGAPGVRGSWRRDEIADLALERITAFNAAGRDVGV